MKLISEDKLVWSPIVVNSRMNRERKASGINSYEKEFKFKPEGYLESKIKESGHASWLDLCCGHGNALIQTAGYFHKRDLQHCIKLKGIDLVDSFSLINKEINSLELTATSLQNWMPDQTYDLITCVHGLHYLGDKLKIIAVAIKALNPAGLFIANLDLANINVQGTKTKDLLKKTISDQGISYNARVRILKRVGPRDIKFDLLYLGADDQYGPNYTGQDSVTSYYTAERFV